MDLSHFDAVGIHYSIRLPFDQVSNSVENALCAYHGLKFLFIQDEYDFTQRAWYWINKLNINLVFTVVPNPGIEEVYPKKELPKTRFVSILTGYVPEKLPETQDLPKPSERALFVGYRGRPLPIRYGQLGVEKISIGEKVKAYCDLNGIPNNIAWSEKSRIYGPGWYDFVLSCRSMLGSESGSNVFDWDGTLNQSIEDYRNKNLGATDEDVYQDVIRTLEIDGLMNQISPRVFEAIASRTVLVLFEGTYSGVIRPGEHFIALKKDYSNLKDVIALLKNGSYVDEMAERAWRDIIASGKYSYKSFVGIVDSEIEFSVNQLGLQDKTLPHNEILASPQITKTPIRANPPQPSTDTIVNTVVGAQDTKDLARRLVIYQWWKLPEWTRQFLKPKLKRFFSKRFN
jgi:hypothetical protein